MMRRGVRFWTLAVVMGGLAAAASWGCSNDDGEGGGTGATAARGGSSGTGATGNGGAAGGGSGGVTAGSGPEVGGVTGTGATGTGGTFVFGETQCTDGVDNDDDGVVDGMDFHCMGPMDNDEGSFATGIPGDNSDEKWQDCFFDGNSGAGDDGCRYSSECLTGALPTDDPDCEITQQCQDYCSQFVPNGCDCFGCCEVYQDGVARTIYLASCTDPTDPATCTECTPDTACGNTCDTCELCLGKTELPPECLPQGEGGAGGAPPILPTCPDGVTPCDLNNPCPSPMYCLTGCCVAPPA